MLVPARDRTMTAAVEDLSPPRHGDVTAAGHDRVALAECPPRHAGPAVAATHRHGDRMSSSFLQALAEQRWDDHRYYHQSRINQALHLISACCFLVSYVLLFSDPALAALLGWGVSMTTRQAGHFFFEPKGYDHANQVTHEYKEEVKVGYNLQRKVVLMAAWALSPLLLWLSPSLFGFIEPSTTLAGFAHDVGLLWLALGIAGLLFRMVQLSATRDLQTAVVWATKIITDPFVDVKLYWKAPYWLLRGQLIDPAPNQR
jgi:hypothetical protein